MPGCPTRPAAAGALLAIALAAAACAHDVHVRLPADPDEPTGSINVVLTQPAKDLTVAVNGALVAERAHTKKVHVEGVTAGMVEIDIAAGGGPERVERHVRVLVGAGETVSIPVGAPSQSLGSSVKMGVFTAVAYILSRAIIWAL